jgi:hypothetical protein
MLQPPKESNAAPVGRRLHFKPNLPNRLSARHALQSGYGQARLADWLYEYTS